MWSNERLREAKLIRHIVRRDWALSLSDFLELTWAEYILLAAKTAETFEARKNKRIR